MDVSTGELEFRDTIAQDFDLPGLLTFVYILSPLFPPALGDQTDEGSVLQQISIPLEEKGSLTRWEDRSRLAAQLGDWKSSSLKMSLMSPTSSVDFGLEFLSLVFRSLFRSIRIWLGFEESKNYPPRRRLVAGVLSLGINGHPRTFLSMNQIK